jgi:hypothetical protein
MSKEDNLEDALYILENDYIVKTSKAMAKGIYSGLNSLADIIIHPFDNLIYPTSELVCDAALISSKYYDLQSMDSDQIQIFNIMNNVIKTNPEIYNNATFRMSRKGQMINTNVDNFFNKYSSYQQIESLSHIGTTFLAPGAIVKGVMNYSRYGVLYPPAFGNRCFDVSKFADSSYVLKNHNLADIRSFEGYNSFKSFIYAITTNDKLLIGLPRTSTEIMRSRFNKLFPSREINHTDLTGLRSVYTAGEISVKNGYITKMNNFSGHYVPRGNHLDKLTKNMFIRNGFTEARSIPIEFSELHTFKPNITYRPFNLLTNIITGISTTINENRDIPFVPITIDNKWKQSQVTKSNGINLFKTNSEHHKIYGSIMGNWKSNPRAPFVVMGHGSPESFRIENETYIKILNSDKQLEYKYNKKVELNAYELSQIIKSSEYKPGQPIALFGCKAGSYSNGIAQQLANEMNVPVTAPTEQAGTFDNHKYIVTVTNETGKIGEFKTFYPNNMISSFSPFDTMNKNSNDYLNFHHDGY